MTDAHQDVAGLVATDEYQPRTTGRCVEILRAQDQNPRSWQQEAADRLESLSQALREAEAREQKLQTALAFWMPGVDLRLDEATLELAADDAYLLAGMNDWRDTPCWGDGMLERALAAGSRLAEAMRVIEPFAELSEKFDGEDEDVIVSHVSDGVKTAYVTVAQLHAARAFITGNGGKDGG